MEKRTRDTYRLIQDTYIALMGETPYDRIKIREIAEAAHIQRSTFYQYYDNLNALISALEAELLGEMVFYKETEFDINHIEPLQSVRDWFAWGMDRRDYLLALMGENGDPYFEEKFKKKYMPERASNLRRNKYSGGNSPRKKTSARQVFLDSKSAKI